MKKNRCFKSVAILATLLVLGSLYLSCSRCAPLADGEYTLHLLSTNDIHGHWFDSLYVTPADDGSATLQTRRSLFSINTFVKNFRDSVGEENVILVDAGDCLQGDNAPYFFNYIDTVDSHLFAKMVDYMKYDAVIVGNHDIETGHPVYDKVKKDLDERGIPFLAGNAIRKDNKRPYFQTYTIVERAGLKVAILGYTNANIKAWLSEELWSGMTFESLIPIVQNDIDRIAKKEKPNILIVVVHSGTGEGDGTQLENQGLDLYNTLTGADFLVCSHNHRAYIAQNETIAFLNSGSHARNIAHGEITIKIKDGKVISKVFKTELIENTFEPDTAMRSAFQKDFEKVKAFTLTPVGELTTDLYTRDAFKGMSPYINLVHTLGLTETGAELSIAAPLSYNKKISAGQLVFNDLFTLYPYENQLFVIKMSGEEIKNYLEYSYDGWIVTDNPSHLLKIHPQDDLRYSQHKWSFVNRSYNFDSAAGINYTVDIHKPFGERVTILSMASGESFDPNKIYTVAITSYRASGGGGLLENAGVDTEQIDERIVARYPEYREILYQYLKKHEVLSPESIGDKNLIGEWHFVPQKEAERRIADDMKLLFD